MTLVLLILGLTAVTMVAAATAGSAMPALKAISLLNAGKYAEAERFLLGVANSAQRHEVRNAARYNLAVALHRQGRFDESLAQLMMIPLPELDPSLHGAANALFGWNLIFLKRDHAMAERCLRASGPLVGRATTQFALAYLALLAGRAGEAESIIRSVTSTPPDRKSMLGTSDGSALVIDQRFEAIIEEHMLGLCALERSDLALARQHFTRVAHCGHPSFYPQHAGALLGQIGHVPLLGQAA